MASGTVKATEVSGEKNIVAQIAQLSWEKVKSAEKMAGAEKKYAKKKLRVGEEGGLTQEEFSKKYGRGSFFRKALGSQFGGDKIARNRGRLESFFDKDVPGGRDATKSRQGRYREGFNYPDVEPKNPIVGRKPKASGGGGGGERKSSGSNRAAISEAMASALAGIEIQLTRLSEKFTSTVSVPEGLTEIINRQSQVITAGFDGLSKALYTLLGSIQKQTATMVRLDQEQKNLDAKNLDRQQALDEESALEGMGPGAGNLAAQDITSSRGGKGGGGGILGKMFGASALASRIGRRGAGRAGVRAAAALGGRSAAKFMTKGTGKAFQKAGLKAGLKKIPLLGLGVGAFFAAQRAMKGDMIGAGLELASGAASLVPGAGTAASIGVDGVLAARDAGVIPFAKGGMVTKPTLGIVGEGKDPELITPWNKKTFDMMNKARLEAIQKNKNKFADVQAKGLEEYYENRGGWQKFGEILMSLFGGSPDGTPPGPPPGAEDIKGEGLKSGDVPTLAKFKEFLKGSPMEAEAESIYKTALKEGVNPAFFATVARQESSLGTSELARTMNNPYGYHPTSGTKYESFTQATEVVARALRRSDGYYAGAGKFDYSSVMHTYAPASENNTSNYLTNQFSWLREMGASQQIFLPRNAESKIDINTGKLKQAAAPAATPAPKPSWALSINNYGLPTGAEVPFTHKGVEYIAERAAAGGKEGWAVFKKTWHGDELVNTQGNLNDDLKGPMIQAIQERTNQSLAPSPRAAETSNRTAAASEEVARARTSGPNVQVSVVNTGGGGGAAVPKTDSAMPSPGRDAFVNLSLDARSVG